MAPRRIPARAEASGAAVRHHRAERAAVSRAARGWWTTLGKYWADGSAAPREAARSYLTLEGLRSQYLYGVQDASLIDPDNWFIDKTLIDRVATGANDEIFPENVVRQILTDHPSAEYHTLPTGHFAQREGTQPRPTAGCRTWGA